MRKLRKVSSDILPETYYQQADIRMRSCGLRQLVDDKSVAKLSADLLQVDCQTAGLLQVVSTCLQMTTSCHKS